MNKAVITGMGINCCAGNNIKEFFDNLSSPPDGHLFTDKLPFDLDLELVYGKVDDSVYNKYNQLEENPSSILSYDSAAQCINMAKENGFKGEIDSLLVGTSTGGQKFCEDYIDSLLEGRQSDFSYLNQGSMSSTARTIANKFELEVRIQTISTACTSSANAIALAASLIENGKSKAVLAGGADAICRTTLSGFSILGLTGRSASRPFGSDRKGMTLGEGSAFLLIEDKNQVIKENRTYFAEITGYGFSSDAYSMTSPCEDGRGAAAAMKLALKKADLSPDDIGFINAHGTGTVFNDRSEASAINSVFTKKIAVSSIKGLVGHTLGAAGAIEAIASIYSLINRKAFPNFFSFEAGEDCSVLLTPGSGLELKADQSVLSNSFAFGGNNCSLIFSSSEN